MRLPWTQALHVASPSDRRLKHLPSPLNLQAPLSIISPQIALSSTARCASECLDASANTKAIAAGPEVCRCLAEAPGSEIDQAEPFECYMSCPDDTSQLCGGLQRRGPASNLTLAGVLQYAVGLSANAMPPCHPVLMFAPRIPRPRHGLQVRRQLLRLFDAAHRGHGG